CPGNRAFLRKFQVQISFCAEFCLTAQFSKILLAEIPNCLGSYLLDFFFAQPLAQARFCIRIALYCFAWAVSNGNNHIASNLDSAWRLSNAPFLHATEETC